MSSHNLSIFQPSCSVVICTRNRPEELNRCLKAVMCMEYPSFDVLVVDNAPEDDRALEVAARWGARYCVEPVIGLSRARNRGAHECRSEIVAYLDDDSVPEPGWLSALVPEFENPHVMVVTGHIGPLHLDTEAERLSAAFGECDIGGHVCRILDRRSRDWFDIASFGGIGNGGNMAFRRSAFDIWPGFDERLGKGSVLDGGEEHYAFFSLIDRGYRIVYTPHAVVRHPYPRTMTHLRTKYLKGLSAATAYMTFLIFEEHRYRFATMRYVAQGLIGTQRPWRPKRAVPRPRVVAWWRRVAAYLLGPLIYAKTCLKHVPKQSKRCRT